MANILALDQASRTSGWAVFEDGALSDNGIFQVTDYDIGQRLVKIRDKVLELVEEYNIDEVIFEDIQLQSSVGNNVSTFKILAEVFGVIYEALEENEIPSSAVLSTVWKSKLGIKGRNRTEQKKNAQAYVEQKYGIKATQDQADAICIGTYKMLLDSSK